MFFSRRLFEKELVRIVLCHLSTIAEEPNMAVRTSATQLLVDLFLNCEPGRALEILDVLEKVCFTKKKKLIFLVPLFLY